MSDALSLPPRPNLEQYRTLAKEFQSACESSDGSAIRNWAGRWAETLARLQALEVTPEVRRQVEGEAKRMEQSWNKFKQATEDAGRCSLADAQLFLARLHGFAGWPDFAKHLDGLARANSPVSNFEGAVDALVSGDPATVGALLRDDPELVRARSTREHRSTLLHYVSANGIEDFRQKTPKNIVEITKMLLKAGADVNAESDAYGGRSTTLGLTATSCHPENAGVQIALLELLIEHGAWIDGPDGGSIVNSCLHNGRQQAAEFLASRGARLDLEGAAGLGQLDIVKSFFDENGKLKATATQKQMQDGFAWACEFGRTSVADFLLQKDLDATLTRDGQIGLHWAAYGGHADIVSLLLERGASIEARDNRFNGTPLDWALHAWANATGAESRHYKVVALLALAGARLDPPSHQGEEDARGAVKKMRSDWRMQAALQGEMPAD